MRAMTDRPPTSIEFQTNVRSAAHTPVVIGVRWSPRRLLHVTGSGDAALALILKGKGCALLFAALTFLVLGNTPDLNPMQ